MKHVIQSRIAYLVLVVLFAGICGCSLDDDLDVQLGEHAAEVGGEPGCTTASLASPNGGSMVASTGGATAVSPDDKYNTSSCPNQYVAEVTGVLSSCSLSAVWDQPLPTNPTSCANARIRYHMYGFKNGAWSGSLFSVGMTGVWAGTFCFFITSSITGAINVAEFSKVRVAAQAWEWVGSRGDHKFVQVQCR